jgi:hypothetical protein
MSLIVAAGLGGAADRREPPSGESSLEIQQQLIDTGGDDETTVIEAVVRNKGHQPVEEVIIRGAIPKGHKLRSAVPEMEKSGEQCLWKLGRIGAGESKKIRLQFVPSADSTVADLKVDLRATFRSAAVSVLETPVRQIAPSVSVLVPESVVAGVPALITIQITNRSNRPSRKAVLQVTLASGLTHVNGKELEKDIGSLETGEMRTVRLEVIPTKSGALPGKVRVRSEGSAWTEQAFTLPAREICLSVSAIAPQNCDHKALIPVTIRVHNEGTDAAKRVRGLIRLPKGLLLKTAISGSAVAEENCVVFDLGEMLPGERRDLRITATAIASGEQRIVAVLSSASGDRASHSVSVRVGEAVPSSPALEGRAP